MKDSSQTLVLVGVWLLLDDSSQAKQPSLMLKRLRNESHSSWTKSVLPAGFWSPASIQCEILSGLEKCGNSIVYHHAHVLLLIYLYRLRKVFTRTRECFVRCTRCTQLSSNKSRAELFTDRADRSRRLHSLLPALLTRLFRSFLTRTAPLTSTAWSGSLEYTHFCIEVMLVEGPRDGKLGTCAGHLFRW